MEREQIDNIICTIMMNDGPDGHVDGHEIITEFILALLNGTGEEWATAYEKDGDNAF